MAELEISTLTIAELRTLKFKVERRIYDLEAYYMRQGIAARLYNTTGTAENPYKLGTEEALLWQEGYDR